MQSMWCGSVVVGSQLKFFTWSVMEGLKDVFDIEDYTLATSWEKLTALLERTIREWISSSAEVKDSTKTINFNGMDLQIQVIRVSKLAQIQPNLYSQDPLATNLKPFLHLGNLADVSVTLEVDFLKYFGPQDFILLKSVESHDLGQEAYLILSSLVMASSHVEGCNLPMIVSSASSPLKFIGRTCLSRRGVKMHVQESRRCPPGFESFAKIRRYFCDHIMSCSFEGRFPETFKGNSVVSVMYKQRNELFRLWRNKSIDEFLFPGFRWGPPENLNVIETIRLTCDWNELAFDSDSKDDTLIDLDPNSASSFKISVFWNSNFSIVDAQFAFMIFSLLELANVGSKFGSLHQILHNMDTSKSVIGPFVKESSQYLLESLHDFELTDSYLDRQLDKIFALRADASFNHSFPRSIPSSPFQSILQSFIMLLVTVYSSDPYKLNLKTFVVFWERFVFRLRNLFDSMSPIPLVECSHPDFSCCLLYQKLQLINFCISHGETLKPQSPLKHGNGALSDLSDEDHFSDAKGGWEDLDDLIPESLIQDIGIVPDGVDLRTNLEGILLKATGKKMNVPILQVELFVAL